MIFSTDYCASQTALPPLAKTLLHEGRAVKSETGVSMATPSSGQSNLTNALEVELAERSSGFVQGVRRRRRFRGWRRESFRLPRNRI